MSSFITHRATPIAVLGQGLVAVYVLLWGRVGPIPMHFGLDGTVDRYGDRAEAAFLIVGMAVRSLVMGLTMDASARMPEANDARRRGLAIAKAIGLVVPCLISAVMAVLALSAHPQDVMSGHGATTAFCGLFAVVGAVMGKVPPNAFVGVRTPWSLNSRLAWDRSNRLAGRLFLGFGLFGMVGAPALPLKLAMPILVAGVLVISGLSVFESWRVWRSDPERRVV